MLRKHPLHQRRIAQIAADAHQPRQRVFILLAIDIDDGMPFAHKSPLQHTAKKSRTARNQNVSHESVYRSNPRAPWRMTQE
jgi:hypothetical protein